MVLPVSNTDNSFLQIRDGELLELEFYAQNVSASPTVSTDYQLPPDPNTLVDPTANTQSHRHATPEPSTSKPVA